VLATRLLPPEEMIEAADEVDAGNIAVIAETSGERFAWNVAITLRRHRLLPSLSWRMKGAHDGATAMIGAAT
jgi:hypothetical protein